MKIAIMSGAYVNSGDFLIEQRSKELIESITGSDVDILKRNVSYDDKHDLLNDYEMIVFAGGPIFQPNVYPKRIPFVSDFQKVKVPVRILGGGWKGYNVTAKVLYKEYVFTEDMISFISAIAKQYPLGCRDWYTMRILQNSKVDNLIMTGCPAWYDINTVNKLDLKKKYKDITIKDKVTIGISDPALACNKVYFYGLIESMLRRYPCADIKLFFHRGISKGDLLKVNGLCRIYPQITYVDMSGSSECFEQYNQCFLHIGFRVHAHIYNLSQGNVSVLINEDARGIGVNHALGIESINCLLKNSRFLKPKMNSNILTIIVEDYIKYIEQSDYVQYRRACRQIKENFVVMEDFVAKMV